MFSRARKTVENQILEIASYMPEIEEVEKTIPDFHNTRYKIHPNNKSSEEDINKVQSKYLS